MADTRKASNRAQTREEKHRDYAAQLRDRKRLRTRRAAIHAALAQAAAMRRSKKRGTGSMNDNMLALGFERIGDDYNPKARTYRGGGDVLTKWREVSA